ncbi:MAG: hypothetical protein CME62_10375 [Halobacteriovoraceae bacterium]|nr:hypothetical protein [Halobacteriovoraceae bacterium]|tara:strand:+ start:9094 stop:9558 length:465 start_codon:yes stop_codon:yes gene_type:complete
MKSIILTLVLMAGNALAIGYEQKNASFTISSIAGNGSRVYYNCNSVEDKVEDVLLQLGAKNIRVRCSGGLDRWGMSTDAFVRASFTALSEDVDGNIIAAVSHEEIRKRSDCHLYSEIVEGVEDKFLMYSVPQVDRCYRAGDRTRIKLSVLKESL